MSLVDTIENILNTKIVSMNLKFCLVNRNKLPFKLNGEMAKPNKENDFVDLSEIINKLEEINMDNCKGVGISVQASKIFAIDVDHCFSKAFDIDSCDDRGKQIIEMFKDKAYIEFSFSGTGLRVLFKTEIINNYSDKYYIKNQNNSIEYYQPNYSYRYVTITGKSIFDNDLQYIQVDFIQDFLEKFMKKEIKKEYAVKTQQEETRDLQTLLKLVRVHYLRDNNFQDLWFTNAPGSGKDESERDYHLVAYLYENITQDKNLIKEIFETSPFFKTKDWKHVNKWNFQNGRYFEYLYNTMRRIK